jgi:hypothetical protein
MKRKLISNLLLVLASVSVFCAARTQYQAGKIVDVEQKTHTRVLYYLVNTPVEREEPYYEISVQIKDMVYTGEYSPRHGADSPPDGTSVEARIEKHFIYIKRPGGEVLRLAISQHIPVQTLMDSSDNQSSKAPDAKPQQ